MAVGGYGRGELAPSSDLDLVLVHEAHDAPGELAERLWYPLWDSGCRLDHSVRSLPQMLAAADDDLRVALGLLDIRHLAGDPNLTLRLRTTALANWRRGARHRLPSLRELVDRRHRSLGELAHVAVPDLKEAEGGLRDATVLKALAATWLVDVHSVELERARHDLLDVRDLLHDHTGRASDRVLPEMWEPLAAALGVTDADAAQRHVRERGRRIAHLTRLTWHRVDAMLARPVPIHRARRPSLLPVAPGIALAGGEIVLDPSARPATDPTLLVRAAAEAAVRDVVLAPATVARLVREGAAMPVPWPRAARDAFVRLLASGRGLLPVWETLEETGALSGLLPEWERIRLLPHASSVHRFTVDRHVVETCVEAADLIRAVSRPDLLVVAALLHDIGKGQLREHSLVGEPLARDIATRMGFDASSADTIALLVRRHLLLADLATTRDPDDPATVAALRAHVPGAAELRLLRALTEADARATAPQAWSTWRASLVDRLTDLALAAAGGDGGTAGTAGSAATGPVAAEIEVEPEMRSGAAWVGVERGASECRVTVVAADRIGLLADVAAMLALQRVPIRSARAWSQEAESVSRVPMQVGVSVWEVEAPDLDARVLREQLAALVEGRLDAARRLTRLLRGASDRLPPLVTVHTDASESATVLEVRADDRPGVVHLVCAALAALDVSVRSAHVNTLGPQAVDVFYVQEHAAGRLGDDRAAEAAHAVRRALVAEA